MIGGSVSMPATRTQDMTPSTYDSDSDEAPEVVTHQSARKQVLSQQRQEAAAHAEAKTAKRKRKTKHEATAEERALPLSDDVLSVVAAHNEDEHAKESVVELKARKQRASQKAKQTKLLETKTHTRHFGNIQVQTLEAVETTQTRALSAPAKEFLTRRTAPSRARMNVLEGHSSQFTKKQKQRSQRT